jgi:PAS domain S-box-containing protein
MIRAAFSGLRVRLILLVLLGIIPALGLALYTASEQRRLAEANVQENQMWLARFVSRGQDQLIDNTHQLLVGLAQVRDVRSGDSAACSTLFANQLKKYPYYTNLGAIEPDGHLFCSALPFVGPVNAADRLFFRQALATRDFAIGDYRIGRVTGKATLAFGYPVLDDTGAVQAIVFATLDLAWINQFMAKGPLPEGAVLFMLDRGGTILAHNPDPERWVGRSLPEAPIVKVILTRQGEGTAEATGVDGIPRLYAFIPLQHAPGSGEVYVSIGIPPAIVFADVHRMLVRNLVGLGLVTLLALVATWAVGNLCILRQVQALVGATRRLAVGDLNARSGLPHGKGELGQLAFAFDEMAQTLQRQQAEVKQTEERLAGIIGSATDGIIAVDEQQRITLLNAAAERLFGCTAADMLGQPLDRFIPERFRSAHAGHIRAFGQTNVTRRTMGELCSIYGLRADGEEFPLEASISQTAVAGHKLFTVILRDVTERRRAEEEIQRQAQELACANAELIRSNKELDDFAYIASHDLKEPLRGLHNYATFLLEDYHDALDDEGRAKLAALARLTQRMEALINSLLYYSRLGRVDLAFGDRDLNKTVAAEVEALAISLQEAGVVVRLPTLLPTMRCDKARVGEIFGNLITNAMKYNDKSEKWIEIGYIAGQAPGDQRTRAGGSTPQVQAARVFYVRDNGIGIPEKHHETIFHIFKRLHARDKYGGGTGVGLSIVKKIVERHGGDIWVESISGEGTTFYFTLEENHEYTISGHSVGGRQP